MIKWVDNIEEVSSMINEGATLHDIGELYGVSKQRMYQVCTKFGIETKARVRKNFLRGREPKYYWLNHILCTNKLAKIDRLYLLDRIHLPDVCPVLGIPLNYNGGCGFRRDNSPSIDQVIAGGGYIEGNMVVMSWRANRIKSDGTWEELEKIAEFVKKYLQS